MVPGGLVDGPIFMTIHDKLLGLHLSEADEFAAFQNDFVTYHDDIGDYSTNEPTMDGTAGSMIMMAPLVAGCGIIIPTPPSSHCLFLMKEE
jgi:endoglucanase